MPFKFAALAQLGERLPYKQEVIGSNPISCTNVSVAKWLRRQAHTLETIGSNPITDTKYALVAELVDASDLKSDGCKAVWVRLPSGAPLTLSL